MTATASITTAGSAKYYSWTPSRSGTYVFESTLSSGDTYGYLYDSNWNVLTSNDDGGSGYNFRITYDLTAGTTYYYGVRWYSSNATGTIKVLLRKQTQYAALSASAAGTAAGATATANISSGGVDYFSFQPTASGTYVFESQSSGDTRGYLYDSNWRELANNDDGGNGLNFRITYALTAGAAYYYGVKFYSASASGTFPVRLRRQFTVTFNANGGTTPTASKTVVNGDAYGTLPTPSYAGRTFAGWYTALSGGSPVTSASAVSLSADQTLYARWSGTITVTFNANGGSVSPASKTVTPNGQYGALPTPVRSGYTFTGWYTSSSGGARVTNTSTVSQTANHTLYAQWSQAAVNPTSVTISPQSLSIQVNGQAKAAATVSPSNATNKAVTWSSGNTYIATVDAGGNVTGRSAGSTTITARTSNGKSASIPVTVTAAGVGASYSPDFRYNFWNTWSSFSPTQNYRIPAERYRQLGYSAAQANLLVRSWGGSCFGFSASSVLFYKDVLQERKYSATADVPHDFKAPNTNSGYDVKLRSMIELFQVSQTMPGNQSYYQPRFNPAAVAAEIDRGNPVMLGMHSNTGGWHEVVIYDYSKSGSTYIFDIYDNSNFVRSLRYVSSSNNSFTYNDSHYVWNPYDYCTYDTVKAKYDQLKRNNYYGAANLLEDPNNGQTYTYILCPLADTTVTDAQGRTATIQGGIIAGGSSLTNIQVVLSDVAEGSPSCLIIVPTGDYTISGPSSLSLAGEDLGIDVVDIPAGKSVSVSSDLKKIGINLSSGDGYSVTYHTYGNLFDEITLSGTACGGVLTTNLFDDHADVSGAARITATASVSGKPAFIEKDTDAGRTLSVQWFNWGGEVTLWIGEMPEDGIFEDDDKMSNWQMVSGVGSNKNAFLADRTQAAAPVADIPGGTYQEKQILVFTKDELADIYYTTDGSDPTLADNAEREFYPGFIEINRTMTVRAVAVRNGYLPSEIVELSYVLPEVSTPAASRNTGRYSGDEPLYVELFSATDDAEIYYTLDGTDPLDPTSSPELYGSAIVLTEGTTLLSAVAVENGCVSEVATYTYDLVSQFNVRLVDQNGSEIKSGNLGQLKKVVLTPTEAAITADTLFAVAFYTADGQMISMNTQRAAANSRTVEVQVSRNVSGAKTLKIFRLNDQYQPIETRVELIP